MKGKLDSEHELCSQYQNFVEENGSSEAFQSQFEGNVAEYLARAKEDKKNKVKLTTCRKKMSSTIMKMLRI
eukprot:UN19768